MKFFISCLLLISMLGLSTCASTSNKQLALAQQSVQTGNFTIAFKQATSSLQADIGNYKTIALFPTVAQGAFNQELNTIEQLKAQQNWDGIAYAYDHVIGMNNSISTLQQSLRAFQISIKTSNVNNTYIANFLAIQPRHVDQERTFYYGKAAEAHYLQGDASASSGSYRLATQSYQKVLSFISTYKDAPAKAAKFKHLADLADANRLYVQGQQAAQQQQYRAAANAFSEVLTFIPNHKDAQQLAFKYKNLADQEDALKYYEQGKRLASQQQYRAAMHAFSESISFVASFRDASMLVHKYKLLADEEDAKQQYALAQQHMESQDFEAAANAFDAAQSFVPNFRDSVFMAQKVRSYIPPSHHELKKLVQASFKDGIPRHYVDYLSNTRSIHDVKVSSIHVRDHGHFDRYGEFWNYTVYVKGSFEYTPSRRDPTVEQTMPIGREFNFHIGKTGYGDWKATIR
ncbi:MAG: hypothetical protein Q9M28_07905 [Mariprofundaceae bacterium]|nr:hypothetical protein [Mariprofundaceae bacterium]